METTTNNSIIVSGPAASGKSHLAKAMMHLLGETKVVFTTGEHAFAAIERQAFPAKDSEVELVVIEEVTQKMIEGIESRLRDWNGLMGANAHYSKLMPVPRMYLTQDSIDKESCRRQIGKMMVVECTHQLKGRN